MIKTRRLKPRFSSGLSTLALAVIMALYCFAAPAAQAKDEIHIGKPAHACSFGYAWVVVGQSGGCYAHTLLIRPGDTVGGVAERLGNYYRWGELCLYRGTGRHAKVYQPGEFNVRLIYPGDRVGGCN